MRIHKALSENGIVSRRKAEELIERGKVTVNGQDLIGAEAIFVEKGEEIKPSFIIPLIITIVVIVAAAVVIVIILTKKGKKY